jgi:23S rRNA pseudouridine955/2504/2580 synthase
MKMQKDVVPASTAPLQAQFVTITEEEAGQRIDNFLLRVCKGVPKSHVYRILRSGEVRVNKGRIDQLYRLVEGDVVRIPPMRMAEKQEGHVPAAEFRLFSKTATAGDRQAGRRGRAWRLRRVVWRDRAVARPRPDAKFLELVHRLDRETSGLLLLAKKRSALTSLHEQMRDGVTDKRYLTWWRATGKRAPAHQAALHKYSTADGERRVSVSPDGMPSHTIFAAEEIRRLCLAGSRTEDRAHAPDPRAPVIVGLPHPGDDKYGDFALNKALQKADTRGASSACSCMRTNYLYASGTGKNMTLNAPLAAECERFLVSLGKPLN